MESQIQPRAAFMQLLGTSERSKIARAFHLRHPISHAAGLIRAYSMPRERHHDLSALSGLSPLDSTSITAAVSDAVTLATSGQTLRHPTPYTGSAGLAYALWRAGTLLGQQAWQQQAQELAASALRRSAHLVDASVLDGRAGVIMVYCLVAAANSTPDQLQPLLSQYTAICSSAAAPASGDSDEFLYGRAGTLFGALLLRQQLGATAVPDAALTALAQQILASGRALCQRVPVLRSCGSPLAYLWPPGPAAEPYLGAAHGLIGILYSLLLLLQHAPHCLTQPQQDLDDIQAALRYVLSCECDAPGSPPGSGGHYPTLMALHGVDSSDSRALVHWCHGAPGAAFMWCLAHKVFGDSTYLPAAVRAGELVWQRGLLKKGPGLCHGVSGNAYALLKLYKTTKDPVWLERAQLFAAFMVSPAGCADWGVPDHPSSLYEGMAGTICLLAELAASAAAGEGEGGDVAGVGLGQQSAAGAADVQLDAVRRLVAFPLFELFG